MKLKHVGIRPLYSLSLLDFKKKLYYEEETEKVWTLRMLKSGCNRTVPDGYVRRDLKDCIYCPWCDEWFSENQWREE